LPIQHPFRPSHRGRGIARAAIVRASITRVVVARAIFALALLSGAAAAQAAYQQPPDVIRRILDAPATPTAITTPDRSAILLLDRPGLPPISEIAAPEYRVAGIRLDPRTSGPSRQNPARGISIMPVAGGEPVKFSMALPAGAGVGIPSTVRAASLRWSELPLTFGTRQAYLNTEISLQRLGDLQSMVVMRTVMRAALPGTRPRDLGGTESLLPRQPRTRGVDRRRAPLGGDARLRARRARSRGDRLRGP